MKVAVVGSGVSGLFAARALSHHCHVDIFEAAAEPGGHAHTVSHDGHQLDTGFLVYNESRYPQFTRMLKQLGVASFPTTMSFSVCDDSDALEYGSETLSSFYAQRKRLRSVRHHRLLAGILRFLVAASRDLRRRQALSMNLGDYLDWRRVSADVGRRFVMPLAGALWSMGDRTLSDFPAEVFLRFLHAHGMLRPVLPPRWRTIVGGSRAYVTALLARTPAILHLNAAVSGIERTPARVAVHLADRSTLLYDHVVVATHADDALALLDDPSEAEQRTLGAIRFSKNEVCLHTDESFLPESPAARAAWNYDATAEDRVAVTYWLNRLQGIAGDTQYCVTLNPRRPLDADRVIARYDTSHPLYDMRALEAQRSLHRIQGAKRTFYAGAYFGFGFHEDGARAGLAAAARLLAC